MSIEAYENTVEGRIMAYFDFTYITAKTFLRPYATAYGFDLNMEAQDAVQEVVQNILESDAFGPALGQGYFKASAENYCKNLIRGKSNESAKNKSEMQMGHRSVSKRPDDVGWIDLAAEVKALPEAQRMAIAERYFGYKAGELTGSVDATKCGIQRARRNMKHLKVAA